MPIPSHISIDQLWQFSVDFYQFRTNKQVLLELQDLAEQNVNLILFLCLLILLKRPINKQLTAILFESINEIDKLITELRRRRRDFKAKHADMTNEQQSKYQSLLKHELELEKSQQAELVLAYNNHLDKMLQNEQALGSLKLHGANLFTEEDANFRGDLGRFNKKEVLTDSRLSKTELRVLAEASNKNTREELVEAIRLSNKEFLESLTPLTDVRLHRNLEQRLDMIFTNLVRFIQESDKLGVYIND